jgi:3-oxoacyl-[acyl-carrier protein] reductase
MSAGFDFAGRTVLVTGGTRGIGAAIANAFAAGGARLLITGTRGDEIARWNQEEGNGNRRYLQADFADSLSLDRFLADLPRHEPIDILINNAGVNRIQPVSEAGPADYEWITAINLRAPFLCARSVAPGMVSRGWGRIINIASIWGVITKPGRVLYTLSKHGLVGMTKTLAVELAASGVLVNTVSPGFTRTELTASTLPPSEMETLAGQVPAGRFAEPEEVAQVVVFLASDLNTYLTGQNLVVDGGFTCV